MKKMDFVQMEVINGGYRPDGWKWTVEQHIGCAIGGAIAGFGLMGVGAYVACLLVLVEDDLVMVDN
ncbi:hypothetical protein FACS1894177_02200 [Bacteroidia bacterium]|nr:hypothetical protein FACS1894177_02200 [Bacteroidia bacterium]